MRPFKNVSYDELDPSVREIARASVMRGNRIILNRAIVSQFMASKNDIHAAVNNVHHIRRLVSASRNLKKYQSGPVEEAEKWIRENLCSFARDGDQYLYSLNSYVSFLEA